ncbi:hypothetical protein C0J52_19208 [Blattella germanica]|nr:hypothetical protein C0J52_19208 [Blattella germanica]
MPKSTSYHKICMSIFFDIKSAYYGCSKNSGAECLVFIVCDSDGLYWRRTRPRSHNSANMINEGSSDYPAWHKIERLLQLLPVSDVTKYLMKQKISS